MISNNWEICADAPSATTNGSNIATVETFCGYKTFYYDGSASLNIYDHEYNGWFDNQITSYGGTFGAGNLLIQSSRIARPTSWSAYINNGYVIVSSYAEYPCNTLDKYLIFLSPTWYYPSGSSSFIHPYKSIHKIAYDLVAEDDQYFAIDSSLYGSGGSFESNGDGAIGILDNSPTFINGGTSSSNPFANLTSRTSELKCDAFPCFVNHELLVLDSGYITNVTLSGISDASKSWNNNQWKNFALFIHEGSGAGWIRNIVAISGTTISISGQFTESTYQPCPLPASGHGYLIIPNSYNLYLSGNSSTELYHMYYDTNPFNSNFVNINLPRGGVTGNGMSFNAIYNTSDPSINCRRIYSFRGGGTSTLDYFDITTESWVNDVPYNKMETFNTGSSYAYPGGDWIYIQKDNTGRWFRFNVVTHTMEPWGTCLYPQGTAVAGNKAFYTKHQTPSGEITYIHMILNSSNIHVRKMVK